MHHMPGPKAAFAKLTHKQLYSHAGTMQTLDHLSTVFSDEDKRKDSEVTYQIRLYTLTSSAVSELSTTE